MFAPAMGQATRLFAGWTLASVTLVLHSRWMVAIRWNSIEILQCYLIPLNILFSTHLHSKLHLGGLVSFFLPHGNVIFAAPQAQVKVSINGQG
jgi:hypothetical protein